jgi:hypothetical protein
MAPYPGWASHTSAICQAGALFVMQDTGWDHALKVTGDGEGLAGHTGAVPLRKLADQAGLTAVLAAPGRSFGAGRWWPAMRRGDRAPAGSSLVRNVACCGHLILTVRG